MVDEACARPSRLPTMSKFINRHNQTEVDPVLTRIVEEDKVAWYKKPNLRYLYLMVCLSVSMVVVARLLMIDSSSPPVWVLS